MNLTFFYDCKQERHPVRAELYCLFNPAVMTLSLSVLICLGLSGNVHAATAVKVSFTLNTNDKYGAPITQDRYYYLYRPDGFSTNTPLPALLVMEYSPGGAAISSFNAKSAQAGFVVVTCSINGNSVGSGWIVDDPLWVGYEDFDYTSEVISRVRASDNCNDFFICGLSKGGHAALAFACERPTQIKAAASLDEFMQLISNIPQVPVPIMAVQGTADGLIPYAMMRDTMDAWRTMNGLSGAEPVTTFESSPLKRGNATQATWRGGKNGTQVAWVTLIGGTHTYPTPTVDTGYNIADGLWAFFSRYLTPLSNTVRIVSQPVNNTQYVSQPASFWVTAIGNAPISYQWQKNGVNISGATSSWYTTPPTALSDNNATYRAIVTNSLCGVTSSNATLTVSSPAAGPTLSAPPTNRTVTAGQPFSFTATASGTGSLSYQWQKDGMNIIDGATSATYSNTAAIPSDSGSTFRVLVTDSTGTTVSRRATLTVLPAPGAPVILTNPVRVNVLFNQTGPFSVTAWSPSPMTYQWQMASVGTANLADIPGATNAVYTPPAPTVAVTQPHRCVVRNAAGTTASACEFLVGAAATNAPNHFAGATAAAAQVGVPFRYQILVRGGTLPVTYGANPLPAGLSVDTDKGVIAGSPTAIGTTAVSISGKNGAGTLTGTLTLTVTASPPPVPVGFWKSAYFGASATDDVVAGDLADPDGDGMQNLIEYAFGRDPLAAGPADFLTLHIQADPHDGFDYLTLSAAKNLNATNIVYSAQVCADLAAPQWTNTVTVLQNSPATFEVRDNTRAASAPRRFMRLEVKQTF